MRQRARAGRDSTRLAEREGEEDDNYSVFHHARVCSVVACHARTRSHIGAHIRTLRIRGQLIIPRSSYNLSNVPALEYAHNVRPLAYLCSRQCALMFFQRVDYERARARHVRDTARMSIRPRILHDGKCPVILCGCLRREHCDIARRESQ